RSLFLSAHIPSHRAAPSEFPFGPSEQSAHSATPPHAAILESAAVGVGSDVDGERIKQGSDGMGRVLTGLFPTAADASAAVQALTSIGIAQEDISLVASDR